uniref:Helicase C-terminal domain-containing protein n=1 Tax=Brassica oleracea var. oleracea TaxID=109376 RepID=A0A0D3BY47_BRAOL
MCEQFMDVNEMIGDEDLIEQKPNVHANGIGNRLYAIYSPHHIQQYVSRMVPRVNPRRPSARELNLLKRKAKISSKDQAKGNGEGADVEMSSWHAPTSTRTLSDSLDSNKANIGNEDDIIEPDVDGRWPFHNFVEQLILDMFDPAWEIRHGSVMALREILMLHGGSAGVSTAEFSSDNGFELKEVLNKVTQEKEIDLNMQFSVDDLEPLRKRPKIEDPSKSFIDNTVLEAMGSDFDINVKDEDVEFLVPPVEVNGQIDSSSIKVEPKSSVDGSSCQSDRNHVAEVSNHLEDKSFVEEPVLPNKHQEENIEVLDLVKQARRSWIKNFEFLQDCTIRFLCVLSLDRFGDYISDQVVAPVREACAQAVGATFKYMSPSLIYETLNILLQMQRRPEWEIRHGSLLGIKYLVAVRQEMLQDLLVHILPACKAGLEDSDGDVRAVAADALIPAAAAIVSLREQTLHYIIPAAAAMYAGSAQHRVSLREQFSNHNVIITSYDVVRKDTDYLTQFSWNYCILDEGHIIKNAKSKITSAVKQLKAHHRLILSGTPIQNNIIELWSLFDFLMPGFLGTERQFQASYGKPLLAARGPKCSAKDAEAGVLAMEALHKQVMPFLLRRTKEEVLSDLPEKIIQDRYCDLSPVQLKLYEQFSGSHAKQEISSIIKVDRSADSGNVDVAPTKASTHVFQALQYLLKLCSHPLLVLGEKVTEPVASDLSAMINGCSDIITELHKVQHSPKLVALQEILEECGIAGFFSMLLICLCLILESSVTYMRLDGSVVPEKRFEIVKAFNSDPTIDVLLLTTHVGGLGLNLTSADTIVFMEHDWNPMRDHQAMDRAHRLGQKRVVNVHRLIMRGTLEEKVMSLQRFKVSVANTVINAENASMKTMNTDQLLDLFASAETTKKGGASLKKGSEDNDQTAGTGKGIKAILGNLEELWDQSQYTEEYNLSHFLAKLNR